MSQPPSSSSSSPDSSDEFERLLRGVGGEPLKLSPEMERTQRILLPQDVQRLAPERPVQATQSVPIYVPRAEERIPLPAPPPRMSNADFTRTAEHPIAATPAPVVLPVPSRPVPVQPAYAAATVAPPPTKPAAPPKASAPAVSKPISVSVPVTSDSSSQHRTMLLLLVVAVLLLVVLSVLLYMSSRPTAG